jgi:hypothetical protein
VHVFLRQPEQCWGFLAVLLVLLCSRVTFWLHFLWTQPSYCSTDYLPTLASLGLFVLIFCIFNCKACLVICPHLRL